MAGIAIGSSSAGNSAIAMGTGASAAPTDSISLGSGAGVGTAADPGGNRHSQIAIGQNSGQNVYGNETVAIGVGAGSNATVNSAVPSTGSIAIGTSAGADLSGAYNVSMGYEANQGAGEVAHAVALGGLTKAGKDAAAVGYQASAADSAVAMGTSAQAATNGVAIGMGAAADAGNIALGLNSAAVSSDADGSGYLTGSAPQTSGVVSVGSTSAGVRRRVVNVADGSNPYDAVNVRQLQGAQTSVATLIGGGVALNPDGSYSAITLKDSGGTSHSFGTVAEAIGAISSGTVDILPADAVTYNAHGGISNVDNAVLATDAVNLQQMNAAIVANGVKYFSVDPASDPANKGNDGASGANALAIGPAASAQGQSALALGNSAAVVNADQALAIGYKSRAYADSATVLGSNSNAYGQAGVAIGQNANSNGDNSIAMGSGALTEAQAVGASVDNAIAIGTGAAATADDAVAIGPSSRAGGVKSVAQGFEALAIGASSQASGTDSTASATNAQASGTGAYASGVSSQARGTNANAAGVNAQASGTGAGSYGSDGIALGTNARSGIANPQSDEEKAKNVNGIAIGNSAVADDVNAMAVGVGAAAHAQSAAAFGDGSQATAVQSLAVGSGASATAVNAAAFGTGAQALNARSVALGDGALTAAAVGTSSATVDKVTYNFAGTSPVGTVSVGTDSDKRTITNVAAGRVSAASTDAINGSQLFGTNAAVTALGNDLDTAGQSVATALGGASAYDPGTHKVTASLTVNSNTYNNVQDALSYVGQGWNLTANGTNSATVAPGGSVDMSPATDNNIVVTKTSGTNSQQVKFGLANNVNIANNLTVGGSTTVTGMSNLNGGAAISNSLVVNPNTAVNFGGNKITNVAAGSADTDAVNVSQLNSLASKPLTFKGDVGQTTRTLGDTMSIHGSLASGASASSGNIRTDVVGDGDMEIMMANNLDLGASGSVAMGDTTVNNTGLSVVDGSGNKTTTTATGTTVTGAAGTTTVAAGNVGVGDGTYTTNILPTQVAVGGANPIVVNGTSGTINGLTNKTFDPDNFTSGQAATEDQLSQVSSGISTKGLDFAGDSGANVHRDLGQTLNVKGGADPSKLTDGNIGVVADNTTGTLSIKLAQNLNLGADGSLAVGNSTIDNTGLSVADGSGNKTTTTAMGTTVADGSGNTTMTTATGTTMTDGSGNKTTTTATGTTVTGSAGTTTVTAGNVGVSDGTNTTTIAPTQVAVGGAHPVTVNGATGTVNGLTNKTFDPDNFTSGQAATEDQLGQVSSDITTKGLGFAGDSGTNVHRDLGQTLNVKGGADTSKLSDNNIGVVADGTDTLAIKLAQNLNLGPDGSLAIGNSTIDNNGLTIDDGAGNTTATTAAGTVVTDGTNTTTVAAGNVGVTDGTYTTSIAPTQVSVGGAYPVIVNGSTGTIGGLQNKVFDPSNIVSGQAATEDQLGMMGNTLNIGLSSDGKSNVINYGGNQYASLSDVLDSLHWNVDASGPTSGTGGTGGTGGSSGSGSSGGSGGSTGATEIHNGNTVTFVAGNNITVDKAPAASGSGDASITIGLAQDISVNSVTATNVTATNVTATNVTANNVKTDTLNANAVIIQDGPTINQNGIDMNNQPITNVAPGVNGTDAVNVNQLNNLATNVANGMNTMQNEINRNDRVASAGIAAAIATAGLPQAYLPGKSMFSIAGGTWRGESGYAMGLSRVTDNGNWVLKATASGSSRGDYGGSVGVGYQW
ncbi:YadA-like family protein [Candidimonas humi]|uniref:YadA-like family protein n=1 Tax=Candidimonas humi TaxID=683355 RepID=A0ABV8P3R4_9BURK